MFVDLFQKSKSFEILLLSQAEYFSGNMTTTLTFRYTVEEGDSTDTFDILDTRTTNRQKFSTALVRVPAAEVRLAGKHTNLLAPCRLGCGPRLLRKPLSALGRVKPASEIKSTESSCV